MFQVCLAKDWVLPQCEFWNLDDGPGLFPQPNHLYRIQVVISAHTTCHVDLIFYTTAAMLRTRLIEVRQRLLPPLSCLHVHYESLCRLDAIIKLTTSQYNAPIGQISDTKIVELMNIEQTFKVSLDQVLSICKVVVFAGIYDYTFSKAKQLLFHQHNPGVMKIETLILKSLNFTRILIKKYEHV